jgi:hypothetical protein
LFTVQIIRIITANYFIFKGINFCGLLTKSIFVGPYTVLVDCYMSACYIQMYNKTISVQGVLIFVDKSIHDNHENWNTTNKKTLTVLFVNVIFFAIDASHSSVH